jgi:GT2 family glycosyltransferase
MLLRRQALGDTIFDNRFFLYGEDMDLCDRLGGAGWNVVYTPRAQIVHYDGRSLDQQPPEMQLNKLRTLREIFRMRNRGHSIVLYDLVVTAGFLLRSVGFGAASLLRPDGGYEARAARSRRMLAEAFRTLTTRQA